MKPFCSFTTVQERVHNTAQSAWDAYVSPSDLSMVRGQLLMRESSTVERTLYPSDWAWGQLCTKLGIPTGYFRRCPDHLQDAQFEHWIEHLKATRREDMELLLRGNGSTLRGFLSSRYAFLDNRALVEAVEPLMEEGLEVAWFEQTDVSFHLRLVNPAMSKYVGEDQFFAGLHIANSEVGMRSLTVDALAYRLVCTNGLIRLVRDRSLYSRRHIGHVPANFTETIRNSAEEAMQASQRMVAEINASREWLIEKPTETLPPLMANWQVSGEVQQSIIDQIVEVAALGETPTGYMLINAVTNTAKAQNPDERFRLESLAGNLLERAATLL